MKKLFYLVRHGEKIKQIGDPPLSENGIKQAELTGKHFKSLGIEKILASPIRRSKETAKYIAKEVGISFEISDLLKERTNWGDDPNQSFDDFLSMWKRASRERSWQPPVGDSSKNSGKRMERVIESLLQSKFKNIVLVTHGGIICDYLKNVFQDMVLKKFTSDELIFDDAIGVCSITTIEVDLSMSEPKLIDFANSTHLL